MDSSYYIFIIAITFAVCYLIRVIPALFFSKLRMSRYWQRVLDLVPYVALTALVFPGIFFCVENSQFAGYIGTAAAIIASIFSLSLSVVVMIAVGAVYLVLIL